MRDVGWARTLEVYERKTQDTLNGKTSHVGHVPVYVHDLKHMLEELRELEQLRTLLKRRESLAPTPA